MSARDVADAHALGAEEILQDLGKQLSIPGRRADISDVALISIAKSLLAIRAELKAFGEAQTGTPINQVTR